jgi:hypothetical protein
MIVLALDRAMEIAEKVPSHQPKCNNQNEQPSDQHYQVFGSVASTVIIKRYCNLVGGKFMSSFLDDLTA